MHKRGCLTFITPLRDLIKETRWIKSTCVVTNIACNNLKLYYNSLHLHVPRISASMAPSIGISVAILCAVWIGGFFISKLRYNYKYKFPNVVPGWPLIGNTLDVPYPAGMFTRELTKKYGEMWERYIHHATALSANTVSRFTLNIGGRKLVYLNSSRTVTDLLEKRSAIYSSRPFRPMLNEIMSGGFRMVFMGYTERWRNQRRIMHSILNGRQAETKFVPFQNLESKQLVYEILNDPENFHKASQRFSNSVILSVIFGRRARNEDELLEFIMGYTSVLGDYQYNPLRSPADVFTWLDKLPKPLQWWRPFGESFFSKHVE